MYVHGTYMFMNVPAMYEHGTETYVHLHSQCYGTGFTSPVQAVFIQGYTC